MGCLAGCVLLADRSGHGALDLPAALSTVRLQDSVAGLALARMANLKEGIAAKRPTAAVAVSQRVVMISNGAPLVANKVLRMERLVSEENHITRDVGAALVAGACK
jgi:hypothetical protein